MDLTAYSDEALVNHYSELSSKVFIMKAVSQGLRIRLEREFTRQVNKLLSSWYSAVSKELLDDGYLQSAYLQASRLKTALPIKNQRRVDSRRMLNDLLIPMYQLNKHSEYVLKAKALYRKWLLIFYELGAITALDSMGFNATSRLVESTKKRLDVSKAAPVIFELTDEEIKFHLENRVIRFGAGLSDDIINDARQLIFNNIYLDNKAVRDVAALIERGHGIIGWRALKIARTEAQAGFSSAMYDMFERSGVKYHTWRTVGDSRVRPQHVANEIAGPIPIGTPFPSGQYHPGDGVLSINCRCALQADLSDKRILIQPWNGQPSTHTSKIMRGDYGTLPDRIGPLFAPPEIISSPKTTFVIPDEMPRLPSGEIDIDALTGIAETRSIIVSALNDLAVELEAKRNQLESLLSSKISKYMMTSITEQLNASSLNRIDLGYIQTLLDNNNLAEALRYLQVNFGVILSRPPVYAPIIIIPENFPEN